MIERALTTYFTAFEFLCPKTNRDFFKKKSSLIIQFLKVVLKSRIKLLVTKHLTGLSDLIAGQSNSIKTQNSKFYAYVCQLCSEKKIKASDFLKFMSLLSGEKEIISLQNFYDFTHRSLVYFTDSQNKKDKVIKA